MSRQLQRDELSGLPVVPPVLLPRTVTCRAGRARHTELQEASSALSAAAPPGLRGRAGGCKTPLVRLYRAAHCA